MYQEHAPAITSLLERPQDERRIGPFVLVEQLGSGGFAPVWLARETYGKTVLRTAAVKLFSLEDTGPRHPDRSRIVEEARALCSVEHPSVVRFYSLIIDEERGVMGLAMEHIAGKPLDQRIASEGRLSVAETLRAGAAIASALAAVHGKGLVHRDVKPSNIVEEAGGTYKLIDFGIASTSASGATDPDVVPASAPTSGEPIALAQTARISGLISGTLGYIDPACFGDGAPASAASDLYALGATLYQCLSGTLPAMAVSTFGGLDPRVLTGRTAPPPLAQRMSDVPPALAALVDRMLAPSRSDRPPSASWVAHRLEQIRRELAGGERALPPEETGPFRGLLRFEERDRDVFFGRAREIAAALELLRGRGMVALVGPSGSGKSSLARAGLLPALAEGALGWPEAWDAAIAEPGRDPRGAIAQALAPFIGDSASLEPETLIDALATRASEQNRGIVLFVDQLEELVTTAEPGSRDEAAALLVRLSEQTLPGVRAVVAARRDLLDPLLAQGALGRALARGLCLVEPISPLDWRDIVQQALSSYGYALEDDALAEELFAGIDATAGAMPLVEFALTELFLARDRQNKKLTRAGLASIGGIAGALERHAEETLAALEASKPGATEAAKAVLVALTTPEGTRAVGSEAELVQIAGDAAKDVIRALGKARLVVPAEGGVTLAHEALITRWGRLAAWVAEARDDRVLGGEIERDAARFHEDEESVALWRGRRLDFANDLLKRGTVRMSGAAIEFVRTSRRAARRGRLLVGGAAALVSLSLFAAGLGVLRAEQKRREDSENNQRKLEEAAQQIQQLIHANESSESKLEDIKKVLDNATSKGPAAPPPAPAEPAATAQPAAPGTPPLGQKPIIAAVRAAPQAKQLAPEPAPPAPAPPAPEARPKATAGGDDLGEAVKPVTTWQ
ncbi:serine/threonine-protein kinase [Polyangium aurulentum]|uniref:serine/threonine-protein kinase n=1 Tax=Polyangium aurulentum TaxID=2567896 RepID=UPI0010AE255F|nr:serine/threonine-protein kinase [Polyangium aurulentum]UQA56083.1 serine/threonine-protein kinase PknK [Polyangium aurulentum]